MSLAIRYNSCGRIAFSTCAALAPSTWKCLVWWWQVLKINVAKVSTRGSGRCPLFSLNLLSINFGVCIASSLGWLRQHRGHALIEWRYFLERAFPTQHLHVLFRFLYFFSTSIWRVILIQEKTEFWKPLFHLWISILDRPDWLASGLYLRLMFLYGRFLLNCAGKIMENLNCAGYRRHLLINNRDSFTSYITDIIIVRWVSKMGWVKSPLIFIFPLKIKLRTFRPASLK